MTQDIDGGREEKSTTMKEKGSAKESREWENSPISFVEFLLLLYLTVTVSTFPHLYHLPLPVSGMWNLQSAPRLLVLDAPSTACGWVNRDSNDLDEDETDNINENQATNRM